MVNALETDVVVIGAGVVGAAIAARLSADGHRVVVVEKARAAGLGVTSRNSGVIHSGLYAPPHWKKSALCVRGQALLYEWAAAHHVAHRVTGKYVLAFTQAEAAALGALADNARAAGAVEVNLLAPRDIADLPAGVVPRAVLEAARTGIIDAVALTGSFVDAATAAGAEVLFAAEVLGFEVQPGRVTVATQRGDASAGLVINCAGLEADRVAALAGVSTPAVFPWRGDYFCLTRRRPGVSKLLYPVRLPGAAGLGVHVTLTLDGRIRLGPDVEPAHRREAFEPREEKLEAFRQAGERLLGPLSADELAWDGCGIRPKLRAFDAADERDFFIERSTPWLWNLVGIESPGLTAAMAIAEHVAQSL